MTSYGSVNQEGRPANRLWHLGLDAFLKVVAYSVLDACSKPMQVYAAIFRVDA